MSPEKIDRIHDGHLRMPLRQATEGFFHRRAGISPGTPGVRSESFDGTALARLPKLAWRLLPLLGLYPEFQQMKANTTRKAATRKTASAILCNATGW